MFVVRQIERRLQFTKHDAGIMTAVFRGAAPRSELSRIQRPLSFTAGQCRERTQRAGSGVEAHHKIMRRQQNREQPQPGAQRFLVIHENMVDIGIVLQCHRSQGTGDHIENRLGIQNTEPMDHRRTDQHVAYAIASDAQYMELAQECTPWTPPGNRPA